MTTTADGRIIDADAVESLAANFRGDLIAPSDPDYDEARKIWNGMVDKRPALIARCSGTADIAAAVGAARSMDLPIAVRGGGHNVAGHALNDDGLVIDLSRLKGISVDSHARTARVQPGANWGDLDRETQLHGLATPGGMMSRTGVAGFTLGGGMGYLRRKWGLASDNLISAEVVTADGNVLTASETEHADLFWAIRGGGGNFGVVTSFEFQLHRLGPEINTAMVVYPAEQIPLVLRNWREYMAQAPDEVCCDMAMTGMPPLPPVPPEMYWAPVMIAFGVYAGPAGEGDAILQPLRELGTPVADMSGRQPYIEVQRALDAAFPDGRQYYWKSFNGSRLSDELIDDFATLCATRPTPQTLVGFRSLGGAMGRIPEDATAYGNRNALFNVSIDASWEDRADTERNVRWVREGWAHLRQLTDASAYVNFAGFGEENDALARSAYGPNFDRLRAIKRKYDPENRFHGNINIAP